MCGCYCRVTEQLSMSERVDGNTPRDTHTHTHSGVYYTQAYRVVKPHPNRKESPRIDVG